MPRARGPYREFTRYHGIIDFLSFIRISPDTGTAGESTFLEVRRGMNLTTPVAAFLLRSIYDEGGGSCTGGFAASALRCRFPVDLCPVDCAVYRRGRAQTPADQARAPDLDRGFR